MLDRSCRMPLPLTDYRVADRHLRSAGKDCRVCFETSPYSVPWRPVQWRMRVELRVHRAVV